MEPIKTSKGSGADSSPPFSLAWSVLISNLSNATSTLLLPGNVTL